MSIAMWLFMFMGVVVFGELFDYISRRMKEKQ